MEAIEYTYIIVESYIPLERSGMHGQIHIRPIPGQDPYLPSMHVECSKELSYNYPLGTRFKLKAKITNKNGGSPFIYSHYSWPFDIIEIK